MRGRPRDDVVLIGPPRVGKSTVARRLALALGRPHHDLDALRRGYYEEAGFDMELNLRLFQEQSWATMYQYWKVFDPYAVERFFADCSGILDIGGGTPIAEHPATFERMARAFEPFDHVVLLLPDPDLERSMTILATRTDDNPAEMEAQRYFIRQGSLQALARKVVYTGAESDEVVTQRVLAALG